MRWIRSVGLGLLLVLTPALPALAVELENAGILAVGPNLVEGTELELSDLPPRYERHRERKADPGLYGGHARLLAL